MIEVAGVSKSFGATRALRDVSLTIPGGRVTGFLGPNGAGKTTLMRIIMGLERPDAGSVRVDGQRFAASRSPLTSMGALLDAAWVHPNRSPRQHLNIVGISHGISTRRVDEVLSLVGLEDVADRRIRGFSLGMRQRLGIAGALLGSPRNLILDEPVNGLDPDGVAWVRALARHLAGLGCTVFVSSHLLSEMALTADRVVVIARGQVLADAGMTELLDRAQPGVLVGSADNGRLGPLIEAAGGTYGATDDDLLLVRGLEPMAIGRVALEAQLPLFRLEPRQTSLEEAYLQMTSSMLDFEALALPGEAR